MEILALLERLSDMSLPVLTLLILYGGWKRYWVWGHQLDEMVKEKDEQILYERTEKDQWKQLMLETRELTNRSVGLATSVVRQAEK